MIDIGSVLADDAEAPKWAEGLRANAGRR